MYSAPSFPGHRGKIYLRQQKLRKKQHADAQKLATKEAARQSYFLQNKTKKAVGNLASASSQVGRKGEERSGILAASRNKTERQALGKQEQWAPRQADLTARGPLGKVKPPTGKWRTKEAGMERHLLPGLWLHWPGFQDSERSRALLAVGQAVRSQVTASQEGGRSRQ